MRQFPVTLVDTGIHFRYADPMNDLALGVGNGGLYRLVSMGCASTGTEAAMVQCALTVWILGVLLWSWSRGGADE